MVMIIAPPGPTQAGWNILHITSTCNLLRFPLTECKGQMGQFETTEICLESCIRPEDNFTGRELSYHHQCWEFPLHNELRLYLWIFLWYFLCGVKMMSHSFSYFIFMCCCKVRWYEMSKFALSPYDKKKNPSESFYIHNQIESCSAINKILSNPAWQK